MISSRTAAGPSSPWANAIVLVGGSGRRLGGVDKAGLHVGGMSLLERMLRATGGLQDAGAGPKTDTAIQTTVVVGQTAERGHVSGAGQVLWTHEEPVGGGPVAAIVAGLSAMPVDAPWTLLLAVDHPGAEVIIPLLARAATNAVAAVAAVCPIDEGGREQWLLAAYRTSSLRSALGESGSGQGQALYPLLRALPDQGVKADPADLRDVDTPADLAAWRERLA